MEALDLNNLFGVKDKVVLVTGGSRGIGKMIATAFALNGAKVYISSRSAKDCEATANELNALCQDVNKAGGGQVIPIAADLQKLSEVERLTAEVAKREKYLHVLVNNAGATWGATIEEFPDEAFAKVMTLNVQRVFTLTQKCLPLLRAAAARGKRGDIWEDPARIINIGSVAGLRVPDSEMYSYSASKAAVHHLSRNLAGRLGWEGITSNSIAPGPFESKMMAHTLRTAGDALVRGIPLYRIGSPEDIAGTTLFLASRAGAYVNGATISLDGGRTTRMTGGKWVHSAKRPSAKL
ncbi:NAD(P)-binding protein [Punctularia strigosozonata HHB-11173 SS5]|uniref:NAD(P)-binding protein n=1 Tax=Punctularia strigosozonata (strain HHB-11173) TaxID=741275 RepID=UPI0004416C36|nr:NAD(P)-binding protein [Punctularia strigosozonata HHB-11173 SS5]EIN06577.1 NAD(P)-binding protein [Punctularia strigosozonata HHB-11173 SS5]